MAVELETFVAGQGVNCNKLNGNFSKLQTQANANESQLRTISDTALLKDGSNLSQEIINKFNEVIPKTLSCNGDVSLEDNSVYYLTLTGNSNIVLPVVDSDQLSHTIIATVNGGLFSLGLGTSKHLLQDIDVDTTAPYNILFIFNKIDNSWYYCLTQ